MGGETKFLNLFGRIRSVVIGMIHVKSLPGSPFNKSSVSAIVEDACREAEIYSYEKIDGLIIENMHDLPYTLAVGPEVCASMTAVCAEVRRTCPSLPLGIQILSAANHQALAVALASGLDFIRAEGYVFSHIADEGLINGCAGELLRYRKQIGAEHIQIFTDIKKKHSSHALTSDVNVVETGRAAEFFLSDGLILTGTATGIQANPAELRDTRMGKKGDLSDFEDGMVVGARRAVMRISETADLLGLSSTTISRAYEEWAGKENKHPGRNCTEECEARNPCYPVAWSGAVAISEVSQAVRIPVLIGSGVTLSNVEHYLDASAMIIGSYFKKGGYWANDVDPERVKNFMGKIHELRG